MARKKWSELAESTKRRKRAQGITPARYNAWNRLSPADRRLADKDDYLIRGMGIKAQRTRAGLRDQAADRITAMMPRAQRSRIDHNVNAMDVAELREVRSAPLRRLFGMTSPPTGDDTEQPSRFVPFYAPTYYT